MAPGEEISDGGVGVVIGGWGQGDGGELVLGVGELDDFHFF